MDLIILLELVVLNKHLNKLNGNVHIILGMMNNKDHIEYSKYFKGKISSLTAVDIPNQPNAINGEDLMKKIKI